MAKVTYIASFAMSCNAGIGKTFTMRGCSIRILFPKHVYHLLHILHNVYPEYPDLCNREFNRNWHFHFVA